MSGRPPLSPFGTAAQSWARSPGAAPPSEGAEALRALEARLRALDLPEAVAPLAFELVRLAPGLDAGGRRGLLYLATVALLDLADGSTRSWVGGEGGRRHLGRRLAALLPEPDLRARVAQDVAWVLEGERAWPVLGQGPEAHAPLIRDGEHLYLQRMLRLEARLAEALAVRARAPRTPGEAGLDDVLARPSVGPAGPVTLSSEQEAAVRHALGRRLTVISGGPGTGKTSIVVALLRAWVRAGVATTDIALAAPTGKAAHRMAEAVRGGLSTIADPAPEDLALAARVPPPATLHRLLGYLPSTGRFAHHENNRLAERVVIVDEASMIDLALMERLVRAVHDDAHLVLLGDAEQLPSVDAGAVLRDVRASEGQLAVQLTRSYRMRPEDPDGRAILGVAQAINRGAPDALAAAGAPTLGDPAALPFRGVALLTGGPTRALVWRFLARWEAEGLDPRARAAGRRTYRFADGAFEDEALQDLLHLERTAGQRKLLCLTRSPAFATGAETVNALVHQRRVAEEGLDGAPDLLPGEPIMMLQNDYERRLFNGDHGFVLRVATESGEEPMAVFRTERGFEPFPLPQLRPRLALAHAMTVHKAQGSEFEHVAVLLPDADLPLLTREILYTAVTRARRSVTLVGDPALLTTGIGRVIERHSGVAEKLRRRLDAPRDA